MLCKLSKRSQGGFVPSLIVVQVSKQDVFGDGLGQGGHGLVVLWDHLCRQKQKYPLQQSTLLQHCAGGHVGKEIKKNSTNT